MFLKIIIYIGFIFPLSVFSQVNIVVETIPRSTPTGDTIFIVGNFNGWQPGDKNYCLIKTGNNNYTITLQSDLKEIEFKFVRGKSWQTVEGDENGYDITNRKCLVVDTTVFLKIHTWRDLEGKEKIIPSTAAENVYVLDSAMYIPQLKRFRRIWIYLPPDYDTSTKNFPVIYMLDGQNLFDNATSNYGEWQVDEILNKLFLNGYEVPIVIGIDHGGDNRLNEYSPFVNAKYGGGEGELYVDFLVNTLKPLVDSNYRTIPTRESTAIYGSSMGGFISTYAAVKHPDIFGKVGAFSPSFWFSDSIYQIAVQNKIDNQFKIFMLAGGKEGKLGDVVADVDKMKSQLMEAGLNPQNIHIQIDPEGEHKETFWRNNFKDAFIWLFKE